MTWLRTRIFPGPSLGRVTLVSREASRGSSWPWGDGDLSIDMVDFKTQS